MLLVPAQLKSFQASILKIVSLLDETAVHDFHSIALRGVWM